ncbi:hypothetical protein D3C71_1377010 [compost metagenome]
MQLLAIETVLPHHFIDKAGGVRVIGEIAAQRLTGMRRRQQESSFYGVVLRHGRGRLRPAATGSE